MLGEKTFEMTEAEYQDHLDSNLGLCTECGTERESCEPDACDYPCPNEACKALAVYGCEQLLMEGSIELIPEGE